MTPASRTGRSGSSENQPAKQCGAQPSGPTQGPKPGVAHTFISRAEKSRTPEERRARIESVLKQLGLPNLDELNRMDREANARANQGRAKDGTT
jgi:hypothetical protein